MDEINVWIGNLKYLRADFTQIDNRGNCEQGRLYFCKPLHFKLDYSGKKNYYILLNGNNLLLFDKDIESQTFYNLKDYAVVEVLTKGFTKNLNYQHTQEDDRVIVCLQQAELQQRFYFIKNSKGWQLTGWENLNKEKELISKVELNLLSMDTAPFSRDIFKHSVII